MKAIVLTCLVFVMSICAALAQTSDAQIQKLKALDATWEKANLELDYDTIDNLLGKEYVWVHNHAGTIDNREAVLDRITRYRKQNNRSTRARTQEEVKVILSGSTAVVTGYTIVDRGPSPVRYHFMRVYAKSEGKWLMVGNHTMAVPGEVGK